MRAFIAWLLLTGAAWSQSITLPSTVQGAPGAFIPIKAETEGSQVQWYTPDAGLNLFPAELLRDSKTTVATALVPGRYRIVAWTAKGDTPSQPAVCVVVITGNPGPTPGPSPGPSPNPEPPTPEPEPQPNPVSGELWFVHFYSSAAPKVDDAAIRSDATLRADLEKRGIKFRSYAVEENDAERLGYAAKLRDTPSPVVFVVVRNTQGRAEFVRTISKPDIDALLKVAKELKP